MKTAGFIKIGKTLFVKKSRTGNLVLQRKGFKNPRFTLTPKAVELLRSFIDDYK